MIISSQASKNEYGSNGPESSSVKTFKNLKGPRTASRMRATAKSQKRETKLSQDLLNLSQDPPVKPKVPKVHLEMAKNLQKEAIDGIVQQEINGYVAAKQLSLSLYQNADISPKNDYGGTEIGQGIESFMPMAAAKQSPIRRFKLPRSFLKTPGLINGGKMSYIGHRPLSPNQAPQNALSISQDSSNPTHT